MKGQEPNRKVLGDKRRVYC